MSSEQQEMLIQKKMAKVSLQHLQENYEEEKASNKHLNNLIERLKLDVTFFQQDVDDSKNINGNSLATFQHIYLDLLEQQRKLVVEMNRKAEFDEELIRKYLGLIDIEELKVREKLLPELPAR